MCEVQPGHEVQRNHGQSESYYYNVPHFASGLVCVWMGGVEWGIGTGESIVWQTMNTLLDKQCVQQ